MRDSKVLFRYNDDPSTASQTLDLRGAEPGIGRKIKISATYKPGSVGSTVTMTVQTSDSASANFVTAATYNIDPVKAAAGGVIFSDFVPETSKQFIKTGWSGLTGGALTDGLDYGLRDGKPATAPFPY